MRKLVLILALGGIGYFLFGTNTGKTVTHVVKSTIVKTSYLNPEGLTVESRITLPEGYSRVPQNPGSFGAYLRSYPLLASGSQVINYTGKPYVYQSGHVGVLDLEVPSNGLQQCADALIRLRAEYLWETNKQDQIGFNFTSGHYCSWSKYAEGYRPIINGNSVRFSKSANADSSKANFYNYLNLIYTYSGTQSLHDELIHIDNPQDIQIGDMLVYPGFPGHIIIVADQIVNNQGKKLLIFAQGNTPAQSVHLLKNLDNTAISPWYEYPEDLSFSIPTYTFSSYVFVRFK